MPADAHAAKAKPSSAGTTHARAARRKMPSGATPTENTQPETFVFANNLWYAWNDPAQSEPTLPVPEDDGIYGDLSSSQLSGDDFIITHDETDGEQSDDGANDTDETSASITAFMGVADPSANEMDTLYGAGPDPLDSPKSLLPWRARLS